MTAPSRVPRRMPLNPDSLPIMPATKSLGSKAPIRPPRKMPESNNKDILIREVAPSIMPSTAFARVEGL